MPTLAVVRARVLDQADADPAPSPDFVRRVNGFINRAYQNAVDEVPFLFFEGEYNFTTIPLYESGDATDTFSTEPYFALNDPDEVDITPEILWGQINDSSSAWVDLPKDRRLDGSEIELIDTSTGDVVHRSVIMGLSSGGDPGGGGEERHIVLLVTPTDPSVIGTGPWKWRILSRVHWLPDDIIEWRSGRVLDDRSFTSMQIIGAGEAENDWYIDEVYDGDTGQPTIAFQRGFQAIKPMAIAPTVALGNIANSDPDEVWLGPEPPGQFQYAMTVCWGKNPTPPQGQGIPHYAWEGEVYSNLTFFTTSAETEQRIYGSDRLRTPRWESVPGPVSDAITTSIPSGATMGQSINVTIPHVVANYGYGFTGTYWSSTSSDSELIARSQFNTMNSGLFVRIYRRRLTVDNTNYSLLGTSTKSAGAKMSAWVGAPEAYDFDDGFYLLAELPIGASVTYYDRGEITPDYSQRLPDVAGYRGVVLYPHPDDSYDVRVRVLRRPRPLVSDTDPLHISESGTEYIIHKALVLYYEYMGQPAMSQMAESKAQTKLDQLRKTVGDMRPDSVPIRKRPARGRNMRGYGRRRVKRLIE